MTILSGIAVCLLFLGLLMWVFPVAVGTFIAWAILGPLVAVLLLLPAVVLILVFALMIAIACLPVLIIFGIFLLV